MKMTKEDDIKDENIIKETLSKYLDITINDDKTINKNIIAPGIIYRGLNISLNFLAIIEVKNTVPKGIAIPGIPFAMTAKPVKK